MALVDLSATEWLAILTHLKQWLGNLLRAGKARKKASRGRHARGHQGGAGNHRVSAVSA
jgi:hypothetical protein